MSDVSWTADFARGTHIQTLAYRHWDEQLKTVGSSILCADGRVGELESTSLQLRVVEERVDDLPNLRLVSVWTPVGEGGLE